MQPLSPTQVQRVLGTRSCGFRSDLGGCGDRHEQYLNMTATLAEVLGLVPIPAYPAAAQQCSGVACTGEDLGSVDTGFVPWLDSQGLPWRSSFGIAAQAFRAWSRCSERGAAVEKHA